MARASMTPHPRRKPRILFLDAYDSFANNVTALLGTLLHADVAVLPVDAPLASPAAFARLLRAYDAVVCGPGPGSPGYAADVGWMRHVWDHNTPALGICLGFQSLVAAHGGEVVRLPCGGLHGMVRDVLAVTLDNDDDANNLFADVPRPFRATLYHSLGVVATGPDWTLRGCPDLAPLAWTDVAAGNGQADDPLHILMAVRHRTRPFWGLQYHPESVCTDAASQTVLVQWLQAAQRWNAATGRQVLDPDSDADAWLRPPTRPRLLGPIPGASLVRGLATQTVDLPRHIQVPDLVAVLTDPEAAHIVLESTSAATPRDGAVDEPMDEDTDEATRGRFSILALEVDLALRIEYRTGDVEATLRQSGTVTTVPLMPDQTIWQLLAEFHAARRLDDAAVPTDRPFVGGLMGYVSYEQGLGDIGVAVLQGAARGHDRPDVCLAWVGRSVVIDHRLGVVHVQRLYGEGEADEATAWVAQTVQQLCTSTQWETREARETTTPDETETETGLDTTVDLPDAAAYEDRVRACQTHIAAGDSYELCLTDQTTVTVTATAAPTASAWHYYRRLRRHNPAPFAAFVRLGGATLVGSSPERFLHYSGGRCAMRPMKGTVPRSAAVATLAAASALLHVPKEEAENLMIVDLVRHDLHGVCGPRVAVPALLRVEAHGRVYQMVSVVEGVLGEKSPNGPSGLDVLAASLPPGSMTGAPKRRSCALLAALERHPARGLYAGVVGYMCASGRGDWSVTIRSLVRWDDESVPTEHGRRDRWHVGAGGAVTILSTPEGEREEMMTKLRGPLGVFW